MRRTGPCRSPTQRHADAATWSVQSCAPHRSGPCPLSTLVHPPRSSSSNCALSLVLGACLSSHVTAPVSLPACHPVTDSRHRADAPTVSTSTSHPHPPAPKLNVLSLPSHPSATSPPPTPPLFLSHLASPYLADHHPLTLTPLPTATPAATTTTTTTTQSHLQDRIHCSRAQSRLVTSSVFLPPVQSTSYLFPCLGAVGLSCLSSRHRHLTGAVVPTRVVAGCTRAGAAGPRWEVDAICVDETRVSAGS